MDPNIIDYHNDLKHFGQSHTYEAISQAVFA